MPLPDGIRWTFAVLAAIRLTWALIVEDGPGGIFAIWRDRMGVYDYGEETYPDGTPMPETARGEWWACKYCISLWPVSLAVILLAWPGWIVTDLILVWLGVAGGVLLAIRWRPWREV